MSYTSQADVIQTYIRTASSAVELGFKLKCNASATHSFTLTKDKFRKSFLKLDEVIQYLCGYSDCELERRVKDDN